MIYYVGDIPYSSEYLEHHGIKGMKWGIRRYQNEDGTLTEAGKKRYQKLTERVEKATNYRNYAKGVADKANSKTGSLSRYAATHAEVQARIAEKAKQKAEADLRKYMDDLEKDRIANGIDQKTLDEGRNFAEKAVKNAGPITKLASRIMAKREERLKSQDDDIEKWYNENESRLKDYTTDELWKEYNLNKKGKSLDSGKAVSIEKGLANARRDPEYKTVLKNERLLSQIGYHFYSNYPGDKARKADDAWEKYSRSDPKIASLRNEQDKAIEKLSKMYGIPPKNLYWEIADMAEELNS